MDRPRHMTAWLESGLYLPSWLRDFHRQKDVFKWIGRQIQGRENMPTWISAHCYTIDVFLWFMAKHGWTLQRCRTHVEFEDLDAKIDALKDQDAAAFRAWLEHGQSEGSETPT